MNRKKIVTKQKPNCFWLQILSLQKKSLRTRTWHFLTNFGRFGDFSDIDLLIAPEADKRIHKIRNMKFIIENFCYNLFVMWIFDVSRVIKEMCFPFHLENFLWNSQSKDFTQEIEKSLKSASLGKQHKLSRFEEGKSFDLSFDIFDKNFFSW